MFILKMFPLIFVNLKCIKNIGGYSYGLLGNSLEETTTIGSSRLICILEEYLEYNLPSERVALYCLELLVK